VIINFITVTLLLKQVFEKAITCTITALIVNILHIKQFYM